MYFNPLRLPGSAMPDTFSPRPPLVILGASARAAAASAVRAGYAPYCMDLFTDRDLRAMAPAVRCPSGQYPHGFVALLNGPAVPGDARVLITGAMENYPTVLREIEKTRKLWGLSGRMIEELRHPLVWRTVPPRPSYFHALRVLEETPVLMNKNERYLVKRRLGAGGRGVRPWVYNEALDEHEYLQSYLEGTPMSAVYLADTGRCVTLGVTQQVIGDPHFGAPPFGYCGTLGPILLPETTHNRVRAIGEALSEYFALSGLFGVDFILDRHDHPHPVEVNPRYTASVEVIEEALGVCVLSQQPQALTDQPIAEEEHASVHPMGKAIVFARCDCVVGDLYDEFTTGEVSDVPDAGVRVEAGHPVCTVVARGDDRNTLAQLHDLAKRVYTRCTSEC
ncbi:MAG: ATP-grasp domain-containing protein [Phycisphaera sp.]|nr:ATP-grasp domain-containing protein [Phycisphaera sp.]